MALVTVQVLALCVSVVVATTEINTQFDCPLPEGIESASSHTCAKYSACQWIEEGRCFLTQQVGYRSVSRYRDSSRRTSMLLRRKSDVTMYGDDVNLLRLDYVQRSGTMAQVTIRDAHKHRYEVPMSLNFYKTRRRKNSRNKYEVKFPQHGENQPLVKFKHAASSIEISPILIYSEQFIEIHIWFDSEDVYGFGENNHDHFRHNVSSGITWPIFARDRPPGDGRENLYGVHPFFLAIENGKGRSFGVFIKNSNAMEYRFQRLNNRTVLTLRTIGGILDMVFIYDSSPMKVLREYHSLIGFPTVPAYWGLGFQLSRFGYENTDDIQRVYNRNKKLGIPQDIQYADIDYMNQRRDFTIDDVLFVNMSGLIRDMRLKNVHFVLIYDPAIAIDFGNYPPVDRGKSADVFVKWMNESLVPTNQCQGCKDYIVGRVWPRNLTLFPDFFSENTVQWWKNELTLFNQIAGQPDGFWIDMNEPSNFGTNQADEGTTINLQCPKSTYDDPPYPTMIARDPDSVSKRLSEKTLCMTAMQTNNVFPVRNEGDGTKLLHYDVHNLYGWSEFYATRVAMNAILKGRRGVLVGRSTYPGSGRWGGHWLGDNTSRWKDLRRSIVGILEMSMFGIPYVGADICGFHGNTTESLCLRWTQLGAFYPFCRNHNTDTAESQDPARWPSVARAARQALSLRYKLLPVLYTLLHLAHRHGVLVLRPLAFQFPKDQTLRDIDTQFLWGDSVMVAGVLYEHSLTQVDVVFPAGGWYDLRNGTLARRSHVSGTIKYDVPMDEMIPVFAREGSVLVMQQNETTTHASRQNPFELHVFGDVAARGELSWDDGESIVHLNSSDRYYHCFFIYKNHTLLTLVTSPDTSTMQRPFISVVTFYGVAKRPQLVLIDQQALSADRMRFDKRSNIFTLAPLKLLMKHDHNITLVYDVK